MTPIEWALILGAVAAVLFIADLFVPSHGLLTVAGVVAVLGAVGFCFAISARAGFLSLAGVIVAAPFATMLALKVWPHTFVGRRMTLSAVPEDAVSPEPAVDGIRVGDSGVTLTDLRPTGMCEIGGKRVEAVSDAGFLRRETRVAVTALVGRKPTVRPVEGEGSVVV